MAVEVASRNESMRNTRPPGDRTDPIHSQNHAKRSGVTWESQKLKKTTSCRGPGEQVSFYISRPSGLAHALPVEREYLS